ncbi:MAG TPA: alpha/beta fold hydrolase [Smithellaceae bacterium]|nr:alpha/beta fold hydrolase [Smithellaceae bacterium]
MVKEEKVFWPNGSLTGEGLWHSGNGNTGAVICHPHPLMGGSMHNNVVEAIRDEWSAAGFSTLRFNFRGVGKSTGHYDEGRGEKQDLWSACAFAKSRGVEKIFLVGYSFGAWICCRLLKEQRSVASSVCLVSPPLKYFDFDWAGLENAVEFIICGDQDMFCDVPVLRKKAERIGAKLTILRGVDHFYFGQEARLAEHLRRYIDEKKA